MRARKLTLKPTFSTKPSFMANVLQHHIEFHPRPVSHAPSPFGFGFGLGPAAASAIAAVGWQPATPGHTNAAAFHQLASVVSQSSRVQKRRLEQEEETESHRYAGQRDESMDRSPTPERPKRAAPKRAKTAPSAVTSKDGSESKENKPPSDDDSDVDVGVLLASLPSQSLLPLLTALLKSQPSLKSSILPLIPRPTLETAIQALAQSAKKLRDAYPYSNAGALSQTSNSSHLAFGRNSISPNPTSFTHSSHNSGSGMRDSYILSRLRPHISEFVSACFSYLPYFSYVTTTLNTLSQSVPNGQPQSHSTALQTLHKDKSHPSETFLFLSALTNHVMSQPPLTQTSLAPMLFPRLSEEWNAWVDRVDDVVNRQGGMFGSETVRSWERGLDEFAENKGFEGASVMRVLRDKWVCRVGWLVGRFVQQPMEEL
ncbi:hypothetical protein AX17_000557 [Amanita inopinata Kibby_2008]|nr:hypothetical protein AX17_000557 [Amanita inopinata Kibby_2008]